MPKGHSVSAFENGVEFVSIRERALFAVEEAVHRDRTVDECKHCSAFFKTSGWLGIWENNFDSFRLEFALDKPRNMKLRNFNILVWYGRNIQHVGNHNVITGCDKRVEIRRRAILPIPARGADRENSKSKHETDLCGHSMVSIEERLPSPGCRQRR